jgi:single-stranded DNA-specific DHH superfamily exonuclease
MGINYVEKNKQQRRKFLNFPYWHEWMTNIDLTERTWSYKKIHKFSTTVDKITFLLMLGLVYDLNVNMPFLDAGVFHMKVIHIISHTDLDGVTAAAVAWHRYFNNGYLIKVSLTGYGDVDNLVLECLKKEENFVVLDLFCQRTQTVDMLDKEFEFPSEPVFFDHHKTTEERFPNRPWAKVDTSMCAAKVYFKWLSERDFLKGKKKEDLAGLVEIANDRDLWIGKIPESRLWQAYITMCGPYSLFARLAADPSPKLARWEHEGTTQFVKMQEERFKRALEEISGADKDLMFVKPNILEFGDVSDFCGLVLDKMENPPLLVAVANRRPQGDWSVSLRSRNALAGRIVGLLKDGRKVRGGGHADAAALYFPPNYSEELIKDSLQSAIKAVKEQEQSAGPTLGDLLKGIKD